MNQHDERKIKEKAVNIFLTCASILALLSGLSTAASAAPGAYRYEKIAESGEAIRELLPPAINRRGLVAFTAVQHTDEIGVFTGNGGALSTIVTNGAAPRSVAIDDSDTVVFSREFTFEGTGGGLFASRRGSITTIIPDGMVTEWCINARGAIALNRHFDIDVNSLYLSYLGRLTQIPNTQRGDGPHLNIRNEILFNLQEPERTRLYLSQAGARPELILDSEDSPLENFGHAVMNDAGTIVFTAWDAARILSGVYMIGRGSLTKLLDSSGLYQGLYLSLGINNAGDIAFLGYLDAGGVGIFTGPDPMRDKVIMTGDALFGSTVESLRYSKDGLNASGVVAFQATLADGRQVIARARPARTR